MPDNLDNIEPKLVDFLSECPHLRTVEVNMVPTVNSPTAVLGFDWPGETAFATGGIVLARYEYFFDIYVPQNPVHKATNMIRDILLDLRKRIRREQMEDWPSFDYLIEGLQLENGGRPFPVEKNLVKSVGITVVAEEGS